MKAGFDRTRRAAALALATLLAGASAAAQSVKVEVDRGPHYVGEAIAIRVTAKDFDEDPTPQVSAPPSTAGRLELAGVSPSVSQSISITNGRMVRTREVVHVFQYRYVAARAGALTVGPFRVSQGQTVADGGAVRLRVQELPSSKDLAVRVNVPESAVFVGERVPVTVEFELEGELAKNLLSYELRAPIFDRQDAFRFLDPARDGDQDVVLQTAGGRIELKGQTQEVRRGGKTFTVVSFERTLVPLVAGSYDLPPATLSILEGTRWQRDFFGGRRATRQRRWGAKDRARTLEVLEIPGGKAPPSFGGAIGSGFTFEVAADRSVVQVGDPITLTLTLRGEGVETAGMPPLDGEGLLAAEDFRVPAALLTGERIGDAKQFVATVRVLREEVDEVPALAYSWFDPETQQYEVTYSRPIALSVRSAEVISAADVESVREPDAQGVAGEGREAPDEPGPRARSFALTGADLAIERDPERMLESGGGTAGGVWLVAGLYAIGLVVVPAAWWDRRRRDVDPRVTASRRVVAAERAKLSAAGALPANEAAAAIAAALRQMLAHAPDAGSLALDTLLGECDARSYAPAGQAEAVDQAFVERALELARGIEESVT